MRLKKHVFCSMFLGKIGFWCNFLHTEGVHHNFERHETRSKVRMSNFAATKMLARRWRAPVALLVPKARPFGGLLVSVLSPQALKPHQKQRSRYRRDATLYFDFGSIQEHLERIALHELM